MKQGWIEKKLVEVCVIGDGNHSSKYPKKSEMVDTGIPFIRATNIVNGVITDSDIRYISIDKHKELKKGHLKTGDILFSNRGQIGKVAIVDSRFDNSNLNSQLAWFRCKESINNKFLIYQLMSPKKTREFSKSQSGTALQQLPIRVIKDINLAIPPLEEQKQIVAKLDQCFEAIDKAKANAAKNLENAKELFQSKLNHIFSQKGEGWVEKKLGEIGKPSMCKRIFKDETLADGEIPFYKIGTFGKGPNAFISKALYREYREKYRFPKKGDVLISASGTIGRTVIYDGEPAYFQDSNIVWIDNNESSVTNMFLFTLYKSVRWGESKGTTIKRLYNSNLENIEIHYPESFEEQKQIVDQLNTLQQQTQSLESKYQQELNSLEELNKSILQKAFEGEL